MEIFKIALCLLVASPLYIGLPYVMIEEFIWDRRARKEKPLNKKGSLP